MPKHQIKKERKHKHKPSEYEAVCLNAAMCEHINALGIASIPEYKIWCHQNGFTKSLNKDYKRRQAELEIGRRRTAKAALDRNREVNRGESTLIDLVDNYAYHASGDYKGKQAEILSVLNDLCRINGESVRAGRQILHHLLAEKTCLFELVYSDQRKKFIQAVVSIAKNHEHFVRPVTDWKPRSHNARRQFCSFVRHLFAKYKMPNFMDDVWVIGTDREQSWYTHMSVGNNIRTAACLPVTLTKRQAHFFCEAPDDYGVNAAFRYGQILALDGPPRLAHAIRPTYLAKEDALRNDDFWYTVVRWFIDNPMLDLVHVGPIVDWLYNQRYAKHQEFVGPGVAIWRDPPQPNLSMHHRDPEATLRAVEAWHNELGRARKTGNLQWVSCGISGFRFAEGEEGKKNMKIWTIRELLSSKELQEDGRTMRHCVGSYGGSCNSGRVSIWTMRCETFEGEQRRLTIEVDNKTRQVVQARGKMNAKGTTQEMNIMGRWARQVGLGIGKYL